MKSERVILVHGTGASQPGPPGNEKWWEGNSAFATELGQLLNEQLGDKSDSREIRRFEIKSFGWSGANSERDRRRSGELLARELAELELNGVPYHLIGHSHGGSVIWNALTALSYKRRPSMLRSWTTVGTPFLTFGDRGALYLLLLCLLTLFTLILVFFSIGALSQVYLSEYERVFRDAPKWALLAVGLCIAIATCPFLYSLWRAGLQLWRRLQSRLRRVNPENYEYLGERWLSIIHPNDEPMSGLKASVIQQPAVFTARLGPVFTDRTTAKNFAANGGSIGGKIELSGGSVASAFVNPVSPTKIYNAVVAPLIDQFLWETVKRVVQGNDVRGEYLVRCDQAPLELERYWTDTSEDLQRTLSEMANAAAAGTADALRLRLVALGSGFSDVASLKDALSWKEVLHTSYFEGRTGIAGILSAFILGIGKRSVSDRVSDNGIRLSEREKVPYRPSGLYLATAAIVLMLCLSATLSSAALETAWLRPYTNSYQDSSMQESIVNASPTSLRLLPNLKDILVRWVLLDRIDMAVSTALRLEDGISYRGKNAKLESLQRIAFAIGLRGDEKALRSLLGMDVCEKVTQDGSCLEGLKKKEVRASILVHAVAGGRIAKNGFDKVAGQSLDSDLPEAESPSREHLTDVLKAVKETDARIVLPASEPDLLDWTSRIWSEGGPQSPICKENRLGAQMGEAKEFLAALRPIDVDELSRVVTLRTDNEMGVVNSGKKSVPTDEDRCGWAILGVAWLRLGDQAKGKKLLELVSSGAGVSKLLRLDFYLGVADAASAYAPRHAKRFLDQSFEAVDESDPALFVETSDGSLADDFVYDKAAILHLYYQIGEYRLAALANILINRLDSTAVYVTLLDAEIARARKYDESVLEALKGIDRIPVYRMF